MESKPIYLENKNKHIRDERILFDEPTHTYTIDGDSNYTSVTTFVHHHFEKFDADKIIDNMMKSKKWPSSKYYNMKREEIKKVWDDNRDCAAQAGTKLHYDIECFYNEIPNENTSIEYKYFEEFNDKYGEQLKPYRTEWTVFHEELKLAGSIDMIFENQDGTLQIYDWKRSKEILKSDNWGKFSTTECINHLPDTNYWHYSLQLNIYRYILEKKYNKNVTGLYLVCLHPDNKNKSYQRIKVNFLDNEMKCLFEKNNE
jgi:ATP-dependent exoDNAse (exonuclease V) beta subunit